MKEDTKFLLLFGSIFGGVGSIFAVIGIIIGMNTRSYVAKAIPAQGTVIDLVEHSSVDSDGHYSYAYYPIVQFTTRAGEPTVFESNSGSDPPGYTRGYRVEVLYRPDKPGSGKINSWLSLWLLPLIFIGLGSIFALVGGIVLVNLFPALMNPKREL